ncbi:MAG: hypothetical protein ACRC1K_06825, partial [Planctomycetia bacterium]
MHARLPNASAPPPSAAALLLLTLFLLCAGCAPNDADSAGGRLEAVWGERGFLPGQFQRPRAAAVDRDGSILLVDMRAQIQRFSPDGKYLGGWETPTHELGRPSGLAFDGDGRLLVADSHYHRVLYYSPDGKLLKSIGGELGDAPLRGEFGYVGDMAEDAAGNLYVAESQQNERITKIDRDGKIVRRWGGRG